MVESLIKKKTFCVITGASQGYGSSIAEHLAKTFSPGSCLLLLARNTDKLEAVSKNITATSPNMQVCFHKFDQSNFTDCSIETFKTIVKDSNINVSEFDQAMVIHNAGVCGDLTKYSWEMTDAGMVENVMNVNITGAVLFNAAFLKCVKDAKVNNTVVINVTSLAAIQPFPSWSLYCASKAARDLFFQTLAKEDTSIRVLNWAPGPLDTDMQELCRKCADENISKYFKDMHEQGKLLSCAESVLKMITVLDKNTFENGQHIDFYDV